MDLINPSCLMRVHSQGSHPSLHQRLLPSPVEACGEDLALPDAAGQEALQAVPAEAVPALAQLERLRARAVLAADLAEHQLLLGVHGLPPPRAGDASAAVRGQSVPRRASLGGVDEEGEEVARGSKALCPLSFPRPKPS